jgi:hypothetical protein
LRKRRTRSHVLADLSANYVERYALLCGYSVERFEHDYGIDLALYTYSPEGEVENGAIYLQLKATDELQTLKGEQTIALEVERADLEYWLDEPMPVILVLYDAQADLAYWLYIQPYLKGRTSFDLSAAGRTVTIHLSKAAVLDENAMRRFGQFRDQVLRQIRGVIQHHE